MTTVEPTPVTFPDPGPPPLQLHLDGRLALVIRQDGVTAYVDGPAILAYLHRVAPILATAERLGPDQLDHIDAMLAERDQIDAILGNRLAFDDVKGGRVGKIRYAVATCATLTAGEAGLRMRIQTLEQQIAGAEINRRQVITEAADRIRVLATALHRYGAHPESCRGYDKDPDDCTCGLTQILDAEPDPSKTGDEDEPLS